MIITLTALVFGIMLGALGLDCVRAFWRAVRMVLAVWAQQELGMPPDWPRRPVRAHRDDSEGVSSDG